MNTQITRSLVALIVVAAVIFFIVKTHIASDTEYNPSVVIDTMVDAGIGHSQSQMDMALIKYRTIMVGTDINAGSAQTIIKALLLLNAMDSAAPIDLYIRTEGGWINDAFAIIDVIESIKAPVNTHAVGGTHSSGAMVLASGTGVRYGYPNSSIMFHAGLYDGDGQYSADKIDNDRIREFWKGHSGIPAKWLTISDEKKFFLTSAEALKFGFIDEIKQGAALPRNETDENLSQKPDQF